MARRDLQLDADRELVVTAGDISLVTDEDSILQALRLRLGLFQGEWFLDETKGLPYFQEILVKNPNTAQIHRLFAEEILETPGVLELLSLELTLTNETRTLAVDFRVTTDVGELSDTVTLSIG